MWRIRAVNRGSSPLARGLPLLLQGCDLAGGIIPARAGFTAGPAGMIPRWRDHPRSRGVYLADLPDVRRKTGSSPLARGLPRGVRRCYRPRRIIPARAGFTTARSRSPCARPDHPRSRGVYVRCTCSLLGVFGSSPLARGLQHTVHEHLVAGRIIPARAGFTLAPFLGSVRWPDHPRSRGVYVSGRFPQVPRPGSSPLARGLLEGVRACEVDQGIIPARAGFTR